MTQPKAVERFGFTLARAVTVDSVDRADESPGGLLIPTAMHSEYLDQAALFPVPRAPQRLRGLLHLRGHAVVALDIALQASTQLPVVQHANVLVLGQAHEAVALICDRPPQRVLLDEADEPATPADVRQENAQQAHARVGWLAPALSQPRRARQDPSVWWWEVDLTVLIDRALHRFGMPSA